MILELDIGNTFCKWRIVASGETVQSGVTTLDREALGWIAPGVVLERARAVCVAGESAEALARNWVQQQFNIELQFARTAANCAGVSCAYDQPARLGADRWLAAVAAYHRCRGAVVVVDAGSALTIDVVTKDGDHLGGYIVPGLASMMAVLQQRTRLVRFQPEQAKTNALAFGTSTELAVGGGVLAALLGAVDIALAEAGRQMGGEYTLVITGGDGDVLLPYICSNNENVLAVPDLVLDGLQLAVP